MSKDKATPAEPVEVSPDGPQGAKVASGDKPAPDSSGKKDEPRTIEVPRAEHFKMKEDLRTANQNLADQKAAFDALNQKMDKVLEAQVTPAKTEWDLIMERGNEDITQPSQSEEEGSKALTPEQIDERVEKRLEERDRKTRMAAGMEAVTPILEKLYPDEAEREKAELRLVEYADKHDLDPVNALRLTHDKQYEELVRLDITKKVEEENAQKLLSKLVELGEGDLAGELGLTPADEVDQGKVIDNALMEEITKSDNPGALIG